MMTRNSKKDKKKKEQYEDSSETEDEEITNKTIFKKLQEMEKSLQFLSTQFDQIQKENKEMKKILKEYGRENENLKERVEELENVVEMAEREKIRNNIIINGIERQGREENVEEVVNKIMKKININTEQKIKKCYRKNKQEKSPIIVEYKEEITKAEVLRATKDTGKITDIDCQLKGRNNIIYINEQLTNTTNKIFYSVRELKKTKKIAYAWTREGHVYAKKTETSQKLKIRNKEDLLKLN